MGQKATAKIEKKVSKKKEQKEKKYSKATQNDHTRSKTVRFPIPLLTQIEALAKEQKKKPSKLVIEFCESALKEIPVSEKE